MLQIVVHVSHEFAPRMVQADLGVHSVGRLGLSYGSLDLKIATTLKTTSLQNYGETRTFEMMMSLSILNRLLSIGIWMTF